MYTIYLIIKKYISKFFYIIDRNSESKRKVGYRETILGTEFPQKTGKLDVAKGTRTQRANKKGA